MEWQTLPVNPHPPTRGREKGRETYKWNIKSFTNNTNNINKKRNNAKYPNPIWSFPELGAGALVSHQQLLGNTGKSQTGLHSGRELNSGTLGSESGSGSQAGQQPGSSSEGVHGRRKRDLRDPPALN